MNNRESRRKQGYLKQVRPVKINVPRPMAERKGVKQGARFVMPNRRLGRDGKLELCSTGQETIFLANIVEVQPQGATDGNIHPTEGHGLPPAERDGSAADERDQGAGPKD